MVEILKRPLPASREELRRTLGFGGSQPRQHHVAWAAFKCCEDALD
jgi:hypothetical protein